MIRRSLFLVTAIGLVLLGQLEGALHVEILRAVGGLPPHIVGAYDEPVSFRQAASGLYFVFDRRGHTVHTVTPDRSATRKVVEIGQEAGRVIQPTGFDIAPDGQFVVADLPRARQRIQTFNPDGTRLGGFFLPGEPAARIMIGNLMLNGASSVQHTGKTLLVSHPESGALFTEYSRGGYPLRSIGQLRETGFGGDDRDLHIAMNAGLPLVDPLGGFYYVFITGTPAFRKYDAKGSLLFERHIEGRELDDYLNTQPTRWPRRRVQEREVPFVVPVLRAAAVDSRGQLWISLGVPYTYVYDAGDKTRTVQFSATGVISPTSLAFGRDGRILVTPGCYEFDPGGR